MWNYIQANGTLEANPSIPIGSIWSISLIELERCCPGTASRWVDSLWGKSLSLFSYSRATWDWGHNEYTVYSVNVAWSTLDWQAVWLMAGDGAPSAYPDKSAMLEQSINLRHCIQLHNTSILSTKPKYLRLDSIPIIWTGRMVSASQVMETSHLQPKRSQEASLTGFSSWVSFSGTNLSSIGSPWFSHTANGKCQVGLRGPFCFCIIPHFYK
jgi:hypothetical protein